MAIHSIHDTATLNNGVEMPWFGLGVFKAPNDQELVDAILTAFDAGYRHIDTAMIYHNEQAVGRAIAEAKLAREEVFITTKLWNDDARTGAVAQAVDASLQRLGLDYVDLYLVHWPVEPILATWEKMQKLYEQGKARAIGVSNFHVRHLDLLLDKADVPPAVNQCEFHPYLQQPDLRLHCLEKNVQFEAWTPIMRGAANDEPVLQDLAGKYRKTPVQVVLRWDLQHGVATIPKSVHADRIRSNADVFDFELADEDMAAIDRLHKPKRYGPDPDNFSF